MAVEDISYAVEKLLEELATNSPNLPTADMWAIKLRISGECSRLAPMKGCESCQGSGEAWNPEARFNLSKCPSCNGHGDYEWWGEEGEDG